MPQTNPLVASFAFALLAVACGTKSSSSAPTCAQLQTQINACPNFSQAEKDSLGPFCASPRATDACRSCLDGHLCGVTEQCDPQCGKAGSDGGSLADGGGGGDSGARACGLKFFPGDYATSCQSALDSACCTQERACGANADCVALIACINACPAPRKDACINACAGDAGASAPGYSELNAIADCTKVAPYMDPPGVSCSWPSGGGH